jgi:transcriptional regulator with PAS, ATPase and Fis domain
MQVKLLHFLENKTFRRVGATRDRTSDARIIAATNRSLEAEIDDNKFRRDLFYRLNVISFAIPPLRERKEDLAELVEYFVGQLRHRMNRPALCLSDHAREQIFQHSWPGNIRELRNTLERSVVLSGEEVVDEIIGLSHEKSNTVSEKSHDSFQPTSLAEIERLHIMRVLDQVGGRREKAAAILGITARTLYRKLSEYDSTK